MDEMVTTDVPHISCSKLPSHLRCNKSLSTPFVVVDSSGTVPDGTTVLLSAWSDDNPNALLKSNRSVMRSHVAKFADLRFIGRSGRGKHLSISIIIQTTPTLTCTYHQAIKVTADGPRELRKWKRRASESSSSKSSTEVNVSVANCAAELSTNQSRSSSITVKPRHSPYPRFRPPIPTGTNDSDSSSESSGSLGQSGSTAAPPVYPHLYNPITPCISAPSTSLQLFPHLYRPLSPQPTPPQPPRRQSDPVLYIPGILATHKTSVIRTLGNPLLNIPTSEDIPLTTIVHSQYLN